MTDITPKIRRRDRSDMINEDLEVIQEVSNETALTKYEFRPESYYNEKSSAPVETKLDVLISSRPSQELKPIKKKSQFCCCSRNVQTSEIK